MLKNQPGSRRSSTDLEARLASTELFGMLDESALRGVALELEWTRLPGGETLFRQGDPGDALYIVTNGRLRVTHQREHGTEEVVGEVGRGEMVGEMAILTAETRAATVRAIRDSELVKFSTEAFHRLVDKYPRVLLHMAGIIARRLRATIRSPNMVAPLSSFAVLPSRPEVLLPDFARRLAASLGSLGPTLHLSSRRFESMWGEEGVAQTHPEAAGTVQIENWLNDQESKYRFVLYEADATLSHWTQRCIRQADHILIVGEADADPIPGALEAAFLPDRAEATTASHTLILLHQDGGRRPSLTHQWLRARQVVRHHHVRLDTDADFDRVARFLAGRATGLVLGGGGARGFAHIGVIRALAEAGIEIDCIGGTSMGAVIAGQYVSGYDYDGMIRISKELFHRSNFDYTLPITALLSARLGAKKLAKLFGEVQIEDLWLPYFCVSANLTRAEMVIHRTGLLRRSIRASASIPGIVPPVSDDGDLLVDGGVLNNLPVDIMNKQCAGGHVIAVDVGGEIDLADNLQYGECLSGWQVLWSRMNPFGSASKVPNIASLLLRSAELATVHDRRRILELCAGTPYLYPPVDQFQVLDFDAIEEIAEVGYRFTLQKIEELQHAKTSSDAGP